MRKVLSIVLVLALVLGSTAFSFGALPSDVKGTKYEDAVNVLMELDVISGYPDGSYKPAGIVTRGEMAKIIICALGLEDYAAGASSFKDMGGHWSDKYVAYAVSLGIINGYPDGTFKPDNTVTYDEAAKMLVAALGYTEEALVGTWPANWVTKARVLGILDGIKAGATGANRGDIALMAFQTLSKAIGKVNKDGDFIATNIGTLGTPEDDTMLGRLGARTHAPANAYNASGTDPDDFVVLGNEASIINLKPYVGMLVTAYENSDGEIIAIKEIKSTFLTGKFVTAYSAAGTFETDDDEYAINAMTASAVGPPVIVGYQEFVNGKAAAAPGFAAGNEYTIAAKVSGLTIQEIYSVSRWNVTNSDQVTKSQLDAIGKSTPTLLTGVFTLDDSKKIDLNEFELVGVDSLEEINEDDIVYVYTGGVPLRITKIEVSKEIVTGEVTKKQGTLAATKYTIDGKAYKIVQTTDVPGAPQPAGPDIGDEVEAYISPDGKIYAYEAVSGTANKLAVVLKTGDGTVNKGLKDDALEIELFLADGSDKVFTVDKALYDDQNPGGAPATIDGGAGTLDAWYDNVILDKTASVGTASWILTAGDLVKYEVNKDGEISALSVVGTHGTSPGLGSTVKLTAKSTFNGFEVDSTATVITYTTLTSAKAGDYGVTTVEKLLNSDLDDAFYTVKNDKIDFLYIKSTSSSADTVVGVIIETEENNSDAGYGVTMLINGEEVHYNSIDLSTYALTDLWEVEFDSAGDVKALTNVMPAGAMKVAKANITSLSGRVVTVTVAPLARTLAKDVIVYTWNGSEYEPGISSDIEDATNFVWFYDAEVGTSDVDDIYDIILVD